MTATAIAPGATPATAPGLRRLVTDTLVITRRNLLRVVRLPQLLLFSTVQPVMFLLLFNYVFGGAMGRALPAGYDYIQWLMPGLLVQIAVFGAGQTAFGLTEDLSKGVVDRFRSLPMTRSAVLAGRTLADLLRNAAVTTLLLSVGFLVGFRPGTGAARFVAGALVALSFGYAMSWVMATIGLLVRNPEATQSAVMLPMFPLVFASSVFLPTQTMPDWLRVFADNQPITVVANAIRGLMLGAPALPAGQDLAAAVTTAAMWVVGIVVVFGGLAVRAYRRVDT